MKSLIGIVLAVFVVVAGCKQKGSSSESMLSGAAKNEEALTVAPETVSVYQGVIPCADCEGIRVTLKLNIVKNTFEEALDYLGRNNSFVTKGNFNTERGFGDDNNATVFILNWDKPEKEQSYYMYYSKDPSTLYKLNLKKELIDSQLNYTLKKQ